MSPAMLAGLERQRALMDERVRCLTESRDAVTAYLDAARSRRAASVS